MKEDKIPKRETNLQRIKANNPPQLGKYTKEVIKIYACYLIHKSIK